MAHAKVYFVIVIQRLGKALKTRPGDLVMPDPFGR